MSFKVAISLPLAGLALVAAAAGPAGADGELRADLGAAISLLGLPCGAVLAATRQAEKDYRVQCSDGHRYRVLIDGNGRVIARKL